MAASRADCVAEGLYSVPRLKDAVPTTMVQDTDFIVTISDVRPRGLLNQETAYPCPIRTPT